MTGDEAKIREWSERFRKQPLARSIVAGLHKRRVEIWRRTFELLQKESPEYRNAVDEEFTDESKAHCGELLRTIIAISAGRVEDFSDDPFGFVRTHAEWRARRQVPLVASLGAYRLAHKMYLGITHESLLKYAGRRETLGSLTMLSDFWIEFFDHVGAVVAEAHAEQERLSVARNTRAYARLMDDLLRGREPRNVESRRLASFCGIRVGTPMVVSIARALPAGNGNQTDLEVALRSVARLIPQVLPSPGFGKLVDIRNDEVVAIVACDNDPARGLITALRRHGFGRRATKGLAAGFGVSLKTTDIARLPEALDEARLALQFVSASRPVVHFADIDLPELLIRRADPAALKLIPDWSRHLESAELGATIRAFAACSLNVRQTAGSLGVHTNTVYFRLNRISKLTGVDARTFSGTSLLLTVLRLIDGR
jgi:hypothetical protein